MEEEALMEFMTLYWPVLLIGVLIGAIVGFLIFRPRQRISLSDNVPLRPHMTQGNRSDALAKEAPDDPTPILAAQVQLSGTDGPPDNLVTLKGVGPKLAAMLNERGITRFDQIAALSPQQVEDIDGSLGTFRGRLVRDRVVEQAGYLARGDLDGYRASFGNL